MIRVYLKKKDKTKLFGVWFTNERHNLDSAVSTKVLTNTFSTTYGMVSRISRKPEGALFWFAQIAALQWFQGYF